MQRALLTERKFMHARKLSDERQTIVRDVHICFRSADFGEIDATADRRIARPGSQRKLMGANAEHDCASQYRVFRGGGWGAKLAANLRTSARMWSNPSHRYNDVGLRCAKDAR